MREKKYASSKDPQRERTGTREIPEITIPEVLSSLTEK